jgi:hypothetical protein
VLALATAYKVMISYILFDAIVICSWALIGIAVINWDPNYTDPNFPLPADYYRYDYGNLATMIYDIYALNTYDNYP